MINIITILYKISIIIVPLIFWISLQYGDRVHLRIRARLFGENISLFIKNNIYISIYTQIQLYFIRPFACLIEILAGFIEGVENMTPIVSLESVSEKPPIIEEPVLNISNKKIINVIDHISDHTINQTVPIQVFKEKPILIKRATMEIIDHIKMNDPRENDPIDIKNNRELQTDSKTIWKKQHIKPLTYNYSSDCAFDESSIKPKNGIKLATRKFAL